MKRVSQQMVAQHKIYFSPLESLTRICYGPWQHKKAFGFQL